MLEKTEIINLTNANIVFLFFFFSSYHMGIGHT